MTDGHLAKNASDDDLTGRKLLYDHYFHEADRMNQRTDWFLIFHAILLEAYFAIPKDEKYSTLTVGSLGLLLSLLWCISGIRAYEIAWQLGHLLREDETDVGEMHKRIFKIRDEIDKRHWYGWSKFLPIFGIVIPALFIVVWMTLLIVRSPRDKYCLVFIIIAVALTTLILIAIISKILAESYSKNRTGN